MGFRIRYWDRWQVDRKEYKEGDQVGRFVYVKEVDPYYDRNGKPYRKALFRCACGNEVELKITRAKQEVQKGCGKCGISKPRRMPYGGAARKSIFASYIRGANDRGLEFSLTFEEFKVLIAMDCYYCGLPPSMEHLVGKNGFNGGCVYSGVDRVDPSVGYTTQNCVPACKYCNRGKWDFTETEYLEHIERVMNYQIRKQHSWWGGVRWAANLLSVIKSTVSVGGLVRALKGLWKPQSQSI